LPAKIVPVYLKTENSMNSSPSPIYIVSGGVGASGEQLVHTVLAQFPGIPVPVKTVAHVKQIEQLKDVVEMASITGGTIVHTLVDARLRKALIRLSQKREVVAIDLMGELISRLSDLLGRKPLGHPGLYRQLHRAYFDRVAAIEFAVAHDDGKKPEDLVLAEIVLVGISRTGKTPLSMYLSMLGWKTANVPLITGLSPPPELFQLDPRRVIGLSIEPGQILAHRRHRQHRLGIVESSSYVDPKAVYEEAEAARQVFRRGGFTAIDVTDKPIETSAEQIVELMTQRFKTGPFGK
jgi:regulator of PEP synthase PpsR (kinase-PPPase family)